MFNLKFEFYEAVKDVTFKECENFDQSGDETSAWRKRRCQLHSDHTMRNHTRSCSSSIGDCDTISETIEGHTIVVGIRCENFSYYCSGAQK